jgi:AraC-like DNA-binding protein
MLSSSRRKSDQTAGDPGEALGLFRQEFVGTSRAQTVKNLFADLRGVNRGEFIGEDTHRHLQGSRLMIDRTQGYGTWELYRLDQDLYVVAADGVYDSPRFEIVPGEGLVEFHLRLSGVLEMTLPRRFEPVIATGPCLLILHQPVGADVSERVLPKRRDIGVSLYCRPEYLTDLVHRNSISRWPLLEEIRAHQGSDSVWYRILPLSPGLLYVAKSLLQSPFRRGIRLLHAEAQALELLCEVLNSADAGLASRSSTPKDTEVRQLEAARRVLCSQFTAPPRIAHIARVVGMSESKLKRCFKSRYGITIFDFGFERRMHHALHLLRTQRLSVEQIAHAVGYRHQTSFSSAFRQHFGFQPRCAQNDRLE